MNNRHFQKALTIAALLMFGGLAHAQELPKAPPTLQLLLEVNLNLEGGAASIRTRAITLDFTAKEKGSGNVTIRDVTNNVTHYRALENSSAERLTQQPWIAITRRPPYFNLAERDSLGQRYGERRIIFQVKTSTLTSNVVTDTIVLEPLLKQYKVSAGSNGHPLIQYAAQQGFTFPLDYYETCKGDCAGTEVADPDLASGSASVSTDALSPGQDNSLVCVIGAVVGLGTLTCHPRPPGAPVASGTCTTKADYHLFEGRELNRFWTIKSVSVSGATAHPHGVNRFLIKFNRENKEARCFAQSQITIGDIVVEGPVEDDFVDAANPWKNAFVRLHLITKPSAPIRPN